MKMKYWLSASAGALALGLMAVSAEAAPLSSAAGDLKASAGQTSAVDQVYWRRHCWRHRGHLHCRRYWVGGYDPYYYDYGYSYGPSIGFFFGGGHHRHHFHHRHH